MPFEAPVEKNGMAIAVHELADFTTLAVAASRAGLARPRLNALVLAGELPAIRIGSNWYVNRRDVNALARQRRPYDFGAKTFQGVRQTLAVLGEHDGATTPELVALTGASRRTVLGRLQILEARGFVRREKNGGPNDPDRAYLTEEGWRVHREELN